MLASLALKTMDMSLYVQDAMPLSDVGMIGYRSLNIGVTSKETISSSSHEMMQMI